jgi:hypothetical protein
MERSCRGTFPSNFLSTVRCDPLYFFALAILRRGGARLVLFRGRYLDHLVLWSMDMYECNVLWICVVDV